MAARRKKKVISKQQKYEAAQEAKGLVHVKVWVPKNFRGDLLLDAQQYRKLARRGGEKS